MLASSHNECAKPKVASDKHKTHKPKRFYPSDSGFTKASDRRNLALTFNKSVSIIQPLLHYDETTTKAADLDNPQCKKV
jgi:hypothetical protein